RREGPTLTLPRQGEARGEDGEALEPEDRQREEDGDRDDPSPTRPTRPERQGRRDREPQQEWRHAQNWRRLGTEGQRLEPVEPQVGADREPDRDDRRREPERDREA